MIFFEQNPAVGALCLIWIGLALVTTAFVFLVLSNRSLSMFGFIVFVLLSLGLLGVSIAIFTSINQANLDLIGQDVWLRLLFGAVGGTLPSSGVLIFAWYVIIGRGKSENPHHYVIAYPFVALLACSIIFGGIAATGNLGLFYGLGIGIAALGIVGTIIISIVNQGIPVDEV